MQYGVKPLRLNLSREEFGVDRRVMLKIFAGSAFLLAAVLAVPVHAAELVVFVSEGCPYCIVWEREVGKIFHLTDEARVLELRRVELEQERPAELRHIKGIRFTPTFVVLDGAREAGRIVGYIGQDQFWGLLGDILESIKRPANPAGKNF